MTSGLQDGVPEPESLLLADEMDVREFGGVAESVGEVLLVVRLEQTLELDGAVEVVLDGPFPAPGDDEDVLDARAHGLLHDELDDRGIDDRQHLLRLGLGRRQEPRAEPGRRDDRLADFREAPWRSRGGTFHKNNLLYAESIPLRRCSGRSEGVTGRVGGGVERRGVRAEHLRCATPPNSHASTLPAVDSLPANP